MKTKYGINIKLIPTITVFCQERRFARILKFIDHITVYDTSKEAELVADRLFNQFDGLIDWIEIKKIHVKG